MEQVENTGHTRRNKHSSREERIQIETLLRTDHVPKQIAKIMGRSTRTIWRELESGWVLHRTV